MKKILFTILTVLLLLLLFSNPATVAGGCSLGLQLWYTSVLPSLLPFMIVSSILVQTNLFQYLNRIYAPILSKVFRISEKSCYAVLIGFLCGFPMGAKVTADLVREKHISTEEGNFLLGFCNNVSPAFFLNYVCLLKLNYREIPWLLVTGFYSIPLIYGLLTRAFYHFLPEPHTKRQASLHRLTIPMLDACIMDSFSTITRLGGYIMLFTIFVQFLKQLPLPSYVLAFASAFLEISCGIHEIASLTGISAFLQKALICMSAAFGGLCICAQTKSVLYGTKLSIRTWLIGRVITSLLTLLPVLLLTADSALHGCC